VRSLGWLLAQSGWAAGVGPATCRIVVMGTQSVEELTMIVTGCRWSLAKGNVFGQPWPERIAGVA